MRRTRLILSCLFALWLGLVHSPGLAQDQPFNPADMNEQFDWVITINTSIIQNYLNYPGSGLHPLTRMVVTYRNTTRLGRQRSTQDVLYEELWYHEGRPIGCRRYTNLGIVPGEQGALYFVTSNDVQNCPAAVANAIARLLLDVGLQSSMLSTAVVPDQIFQQVITSFGQFNFQPYEKQPETGVIARMHVNLTGNASGQSQTVYYFSE